MVSLIFVLWLCCTVSVFPWSFYLPLLLLLWAKRNVILGSIPFYVRTLQGILHCHLAPPFVPPVTDSWTCGGLYNEVFMSVFFFLTSLPFLLNIYIFLQLWEIFYDYPLNNFPLSPYYLSPHFLEFLNQLEIIWISPLCPSSLPHIL